MTYHSYHSIRSNAGLYYHLYRLWFIYFINFRIWKARLGVGVWFMWSEGGEVSLLTGILGYVYRWCFESCPCFNKYRIHVGCQKIREKFSCSILKGPYGLFQYLFVRVCQIWHLWCTSEVFIFILDMSPITGDFWQDWIQIRGKYCRNLPHHRIWMHNSSLLWGMIYHNNHWSNSRIFPQK